MPYFRKRPVIIKAMQFTMESKDQCLEFATCNRYSDDDGDGNPVIKLQTLEGVMTASVGDWIVRGVIGEFYPVKPDIFEKTYEEVDI